ncbi:MAG: transcriptional regulator FilR1 domain-containing protein, partial [Halobacteriales archaeon]|nr:transcriptional regulator FilR1 domain-containing protein [Halobacteriales archaeon]
MGVDRGLVEFVSGSVVRTTVLETIEDAPQKTQVLLDRVDASESAVYDALSALEREGIVHRVEPRVWAPTGIGDAVLSVISVRNNTEALIGADPAYWESHDVGTLPDPFRVRIHELAGAEVVRATETDPHRVVRLVAEAIETASELLLVAPVYHERYETALSAVGPDIEPRLVVDATTAEDRLSGELADDPPDAEGIAARITDINLAMAVTDEALYLSLPTMTGDYDARAEVVADTAQGRRWGTELFDHYWERATPAETFFDEHPDLPVQ